VREGPLVTCPKGLGLLGSEQDLSEWAADAGGACAGARLAGDAETDDQLRVRARRRLDPNEVAQLRQLERLAVQGRGHSAGGGAEQDPPRWVCLAMTAACISRSQESAAIRSSPQDTRATSAGREESGNSLACGSQPR
jgi:hypothetical protein